MSLRLTLHIISVLLLLSKFIRVANHEKAIRAHTPLSFESRSLRRGEWRSRNRAVDAWRADPQGPPQGVLDPAEVSISPRGPTVAASERLVLLSAEATSPISTWSSASSTTTSSKWALQWLPSSRMHFLWIGRSACPDYRRAMSKSQPRRAPLTPSSENFRVACEKCFMC